WERTGAAHEAGRFADELVPVTVPGRRGAPDVVVDRDEHPRPETTLEQLANDISRSALDVQASVIEDNDGARMVLSARSTGAQGAFWAKEQGTKLGLADPRATLVKAQDAEIEIDGQVHARRASNTINDVIAGVTLQLRQAGDEPQTVTIAPTGEGMKDQIKGFVDAYNEVMSVLRTVLTPQEVKSEDGKPTSGRSVSFDPRPMPGDFTLVTLERKLQNVISNKAPGVEGNLSSLALIGIKSGPDGKLKVDDKRLDAAISDSAEGVVELFTKQFNDTGGIARQIQRIAFQESSPAGNLGIGIRDLAAQMFNNANRITDKQQGIKQYEQQLKRRFSDMESNISSLNRQRSQLSAFAAQSSQA
ncbi:MAG: hypothetical protein EOO40_02375, partial [Deltaproteobacteria bacterium]